MTLMYLFTDPSVEDPGLRAIAGLLLKNLIRSKYNTFHPTAKVYIKLQCLRLVGDKEPLVRSTVATIISTLLSIGSIHDWPELLPYLVNMLQTQDMLILEGVFATLLMICEDSAADLTDQSLETLIPAFVMFSSHPVAKIRGVAISCVNQFILLQPAILAQHMDVFVTSLSNTATDSDSFVRKHVCEALVYIFEVSPASLLPFIDKILEYMLLSITDRDEPVALQACEFWLLVFQHTSDLYSVVVPFIKRLLPILVQNVIYAEGSYGIIEDASVPDRPEELRPRFHRRRLQTSGAGSESFVEEYEDEDFDGDDFDESADYAGYDDDDDDEDDGEVQNWNLRRYSATLLEKIISQFSAEIGPAVLSTLEPYLGSDEWKPREAGILVLGVASKHVFPGFPQAIGAFEFLLENLRHPHPLVRETACWSVSRFAAWFHSAPEFEPYMPRVLSAILGSMHDNTKRVQGAACCAFTLISESIGLAMVAYLHSVLPPLIKAFSLFQQNNLLLMYDTLATLVQNVGSAICEESLLSILMPPLLQRWDATPDDSTDIFSLFECLSTLANTLRENFLPYSGVCFNRAVRIIVNTINAEIAYDNNPNLPEPDKSFIVVSFDLLSGIAEGLKGAIEPLVASCPTPLIELIKHCIRDDSEEVRQSAFGLLGDLTVASPAHIGPDNVSLIMPDLVGNLDRDSVSVCNNACWALGEMTKDFSGPIRPFVMEVLPRLMKILSSVTVPSSLRENAAITLGRLGHSCPGELASLLPHFLADWCSVAIAMPLDAMLESAFTGLSCAIAENPPAEQALFSMLCDVVANWRSMSGPFAAGLRQFFNGYSLRAGDRWPVMVGQLSEPTRAQLTELLRH
ncbi:hypothetical protein H696_00609 [Fonticula alba]|uniref:Importin N-terminal domain-containing protein n=1 Tax=Fonticula alba TaxID=691883 RepID=A0A058ZGK4_FONAL|nr:hypothetical protein H696_00609 [Fonticula alba]KCV73063.1 hypothetical protein H696_00609 [Fonticula alba]|eukprot:XP_009492764.1 hypothetical protein H696_00609 [Fonticula alba]